MKQSIIAMALVAAVFLFIGCTGSAASPSAENKPAVKAETYDRDGFATRIDKDGRLWVFIPESEELASFDSKGPPAWHNVRPLAGPGNITMKEAADDTVIDAYLLARPGFVTRIDTQGNLWIFESNDRQWEEYDRQGAPAKHTVRPLAGPDRRTVRAVEGETIDRYMQANQYQ